MLPGGGRLSSAFCDQWRLVSAAPCPAEPMDIAEGVEARQCGRPLCMDASMAFDAVHNWMSALLDHNALVWLVAVVLAAMVGRSDSTVGLMGRRCGMLPGGGRSSLGRNPWGFCTKAREHVEIRLPVSWFLQEKKTISVLGITIDPQGSTLTTVAGIEVAAQRTWFKWSGALLRRVASVQDRIRKLYSTLGAAFMYGSGGWTLSTAVWRRVNQQANRWVRAILGRPRNLTKPWHFLASCETRRARVMNVPSLQEPVCKVSMVGTDIWLGKKPW